jgi:hypothetical protein
VSAAAAEVSALVEVSGPVLRFLAAGAAECDQSVLSSNGSMSLSRCVASGRAGNWHKKEPTFFLFLFLLLFLLLLFFVVIVLAFFTYIRIFISTERRSVS